MQQPERWQSEIWLVSSALIIGWMVSQSFGLGAEFLIITLASYGAWHLYHVLRLIRWLNGSDRSISEAIPGVWHEIYYQLYLSRKRQRQHIQRALSVVKEFRDATNALPDAYVAISRNGEIVWFNDAAQHWLGLRPNVDVGQRISNLVRHPDFIAVVQNERDELAIDIPSPLNPAIVLNVRLTSHRTGQRLIVARDVTHVHRLEQMRQDFVANVSHELRTPITVLMGYLETLSVAGEEKLGRYAKPVTQMQQQAMRMRSLVDDLLFLSRLDNEKQKLQFERIDMQRLLRAMVDDAEIMSGAQRHTITVTLATQSTLKAAPKELQSALWNLVSNAIRYTPAGGTVNLVWRQLESGEACFEVIDNGPGIEAQHIPRLTERFYRVDAGRSRDAGGTGLGLAIVKNVMERHGGRLEIHSQLGKGSTFSCIFPATMCLV
jgi:two-component system phosphate regulon sensor histidine kinase PhoR